MLIRIIDTRENIVDDLFIFPVRFRQIELEDADIRFMDRFPHTLDDGAIFDELRNNIEWRQDDVSVYGKTYPQPRLTAWYGDSGKSYSYSGTTMCPLLWTDLLTSIKTQLEELIETNFNSVLLNLYRNNNDRIGFHSDNESSLGDEPVIASLSYGATRSIIFKHKRRANLSRSIKLTPGSLLVMRGMTQQNWNHGINKQSTPCGPRINLTFRKII